MQRFHRQRKRLQNKLHEQTYDRILNRVEELGLVALIYPPICTFMAPNTIVPP
jgi:hypothetical protein